MSAMIDFLNGISPWWWVALALGLGAVELITFSYFLLWPALGALIVALAMWIDPYLSGAAQIAIFSIVTLLLTGIGWSVRKRQGVLPEDSPLNNRASALIGRHAVVVGTFRAKIGPVEIDGIRWRGRLGEGVDQPDEGETLRIAGTEGMILLLEREAG